MSYLYDSLEEKILTCLVTQGLARSKKKDQNIHNSRAVDPDPDPAAF